MSPARILIVDDQRDAAESLARALSRFCPGAEIVCAVNASVATDRFRTVAPEAVVLDLSLDDRRGVESGFELLADFTSAASPTRVIVLTGHGGMQHGIRALKLGAAAFVEKPADVEHLGALLRDGISQSMLRRSYLRQLEAEPDRLSAVICGSSPAAQELRRQILYAARTNQPVLLSGETGTGKSLCARLIHQSSARASGQFVRYQPMFGTADLIHSDLFGHRKGAFTGAVTARKGLLHESDGGTLFLDEIDELPIETQVTLLGVLQDRLFRPLGSTASEHADFRLISATNSDLAAALEQRKLRRDLYHRIAYLTIAIPPLRERSGDVAELAEIALQRLRDSERMNVFRIGSEALEVLQSYSWPGNIRELEAVVERAAFQADFSGRTAINAEDLRLEVAGTSSAMTGGLAARVEIFKRRSVELALSETGGNQVTAAQRLGVDRSTLRRILARTA